MKKNVLAIICFALFLAQCKKEEVRPTVEESKTESQKLGDIMLSSSELATIPYKTNDVLIFVDSFNDTLQYNVISRSSNFIRYYKDGGTDAKTDYYDIENNTIVLVDKFNNRSSLSVSAPYPSYVLSKYAGKSEFHISICLPSEKVTPENRPFTYGCFIDTNSFYKTFDDSDVLSHESITINNSAFKSVCEFGDMNVSDADSVERIVKVYYSREKGIVGLVSSSGHKWSLI